MLAASSHAAPVNFAGPFELRDALTFYVVNETGSDFTINARWRDERQSQMDRPVLIRVFDPDEHLVYRSDDPGQRISGPPPEHVASVPVKVNGAGVYQVAVTAFGGGTLDFSTSPAMSFGVYGSPDLVGHQNQFAQSFVYLPPGLATLPMHCDGTISDLKLCDESGAVKAQAAGAQQGASATLPANGEHIWTLSVRSMSDYRLNFAGLPIILCPDPQTARAIHASVDVLTDGTICFHKFQIRAQEILKRYRAMGSLAFAVQPPDLSAFKTQWLMEPQRNQLLLGSYGVYSALPATLQQQNLDPKSPWFGTIFVWRDGNGRARADNPWTSYTRLGLTQVAETATVLGAVYTINQPFNPLFKNAALRNRVIIASLQDMMMLREHELPVGESPLYYGGERAFAFERFTRNFPWIIRDCPPDVRQVWTEGLRRFADRESIGEVANVVNQWTFIITGLQHFFDGSGEQWYADIVRRHVRWLLSRNQWSCGRRAAGYFDESEGPDATYNGITAHNLAWLQGQTRDQPLRAVLLESLRQCFELFNHTIAPEPGGKLLGCSSFCHRTPGDWTTPQYGAGAGILADQVAQVAPLAGKAWLSHQSLRNPADRHGAEAALMQNLKYLDAAAYTNKSIGPHVIANGPEISFAIWEHYARTALHGDLPMLTETNFTRNFGDEFFCVRRPGYYTFLYAGQTMSQWQKNDRPTDAHKQYPRNGGGLCMFWSPEFGSSILGKNWSAYTAATLIAEQGPSSRQQSAVGGADWEDYWSVHNTFDQQSAQASITGTLRDQPVEFKREYRFLDDKITCNLTLHAQSAVNFNAMWECFPYPLDKPSPIRVTLLDAQGNPMVNGPASAIMFQTSSAQVHLIVFAKPRRCDVGIEHCIDVYQQPHEYGRVLAELPAQWHADQSQEFQWSMMAIRADQVAAVIRRGTQ